jgi:hypothetical protein
VTTTEPVLVIAFNRPDHLSVLLDRLRQVQPGRVFLAVDGPRPDRPEEAERVRAVHSLASAIDWDCEVQTLFQESNLGCGRGVSTAISWFFEHVERGIILEDDIIPDPSFFPFCTELLDRYEDDERVFAISGCNFVPPEALSRPDEAYRFSQVAHIWGWATWRRTWDLHQLDIAGWQRQLPPQRLWTRAGHSIPGTVYWASTFQILARHEVDTWDGQLVFAGMVANRLTANSNVNLVRNIGFDEFATHTHIDRGDLQPEGSIRLPTHPVPVHVDQKADAWTRKNHFLATWRGMLYQGWRYIKVRERSGA